MVLADNTLESGQIIDLHLLEDTTYPKLTSARRIYLENSESTGDLLFIDPEAALDALCSELQSGIDHEITSWSNQPANITATDARNNNGKRALATINYFSKNLKYATPAALEYMLKSGKHFVQELLELSISTHLAHKVEENTFSGNLPGIIAFCAQIDLQTTIRTVRAYSFIDEKKIVTGLLVACREKKGLLQRIKTENKRLYLGVCNKFVDDPTTINHNVVDDLMPELAAQYKPNKEKNSLTQVAHTKQWQEAESFEHLHKDSILFAIAKHMQAYASKDATIEADMRRMLRAPLEAFLEQRPARKNKQWSRRATTKSVKELFMYYTKAKEDFGIPPIKRFELGIKHSNILDKPEDAELAASLHEQLQNYDFPEYLTEPLTTELLAIDVRTAKIIIERLKNYKNGPQQFAEAEMPALWHSIFLWQNGDQIIESLPTHNSFLAADSEQDAFAELLLATSENSEQTVCAYLQRANDRRLQGEQDDAQAHQAGTEVHNKGSAAAKQQATAAYLYAHAFKHKSDQKLPTCSEETLRILFKHMAKDSQMFIRGLKLLEYNELAYSILLENITELRAHGCSNYQLALLLYKPSFVPDLKRGNVTEHTGVQPEVLVNAVHAEWNNTGEARHPTLVEMLAPKIASRVRIRRSDQKKIPSLGLEEQIGDNLAAQIHPNINREALAFLYVPRMQFKKRVNAVLEAMPNVVRDAINDVQRNVRDGIDACLEHKKKLGVLVLVSTLAGAAIKYVTHQNHNDEAKNTMVQLEPPFGNTPKTIPDPNGTENIPPEFPDVSTTENRPTDSPKIVPELGNRVPQSADESNNTGPVQPPSLNDAMSTQFAPEVAEADRSIHYTLAKPLLGDDQYLHMHIVTDEDPHTYQSITSTKANDAIAEYIHTTFNNEAERTNAAKDATANAITLPMVAEQTIIPLPYGANAPLNIALNMQKSGVVYYVGNNANNANIAGTTNIVHFSVRNRALQPLTLNQDGTPYSIRQLRVAVVQDYLSHVGDKTSASAFMTHFKPKLDRAVIQTLAPELCDVLTAIESAGASMPATEAMETLRTAVERFIRYTPTKVYQPLRNRTQPDSKGHHAYLETILTVREGECQQCSRLLQELLAQVGIPSVISDCYRADSTIVPVAIAHHATFVPVVAADTGSVYFKIYDATPADLRQHVQQQQQVKKVESLLENMNATGKPMTLQDIADAKNLLEDIKNSLAQSTSAIPQEGVQADVQISETSGNTTIQTTENSNNVPNDGIPHTVLDAIKKAPEPIDNLQEQLEELECMLYAAEYDVNSTNNSQNAVDSDVKDESTIASEDRQLLPDESAPVPEIQLDTLAENKAVENMQAREVAYKELLLALGLTIAAITAWRKRNAITKGLQQLQKFATSRKKEVDAPATTEPLPSATTTSRKRPRSVAKVATQFLARIIPVVPYIKQYDAWQAELEDAQQLHIQQSRPPSASELDAIFTIPATVSAEVDQNNTAVLDAVLTRERVEKNQINNLLRYADEFIRTHFEQLQSVGPTGQQVSYQAIAAKTLATWMRTMLYKKSYLQKWVNQTSEDDLQLDLKIRLLESLLTPHIIPIREKPDLQCPLAIIQRRKDEQTFKAALTSLKAKQRFKICDTKQPAEHFPALLHITNLQ